MPHDRTDYVWLDRRRCEACGECVTACPREVIGLIRFPGHRHAVMRRGEECRGCLKCVKACEQGALVAREREKKKPAAAFSPASPRP